MTRIIQTGAAINRPGTKLTTFIPVRIKRHGGRKVVIPAAAGDKMPEHDAPMLVRSILDGRQPKTLSLLWLKNHLPPADWDEQHRLFEGFDA